MAPSMAGLGFGLRLTTNVFSALFTLVRHKIHATYHGWTYQVGDSPRNVVVVGGSFAGIQTAKFLTERLPSGWRVVLVEKNSHFNFLFNFPRFSVLQGYERKAFIPYGEVMRTAPAGSFHHVQDFAARIDSNSVWTKSGEAIEYGYLVIATGSTQQLPAKVTSTDINGGCEELQSVQQRVQEARRIAVVGAGAVGIELATDIKSFNPEKNVTIFSSRDRILPSFGPELHNRASKIIEEMGVMIRYNERAQVLPDSKSLRLSNGEMEKFDLVLACTGQTPNTQLLQEHLPKAVSATTRRVIVKPTLQVEASTSDASADNIFALGDVAETGGPKMARAAQFQSLIVAENIVSMIGGKKPPRTYKPRVMMEGPIKLTLGKGKLCVFIPDPEGINRVFETKEKHDDLDIARGWEMMGARLPKEV